MLEKKCVQNVLVNTRVKLKHIMRTALISYYALFSSFESVSLIVKEEYSFINSKKLANVDCIGLK